MAAQAIVASKAIDKVTEKPALLLLLLVPIAVPLIVGAIAKNTLVDPAAESLGLKSSWADKKQETDRAKYLKTAFNPNYWREMSRQGKKFNFFDSKSGPKVAEIIYKANRPWYGNDNEAAVYGVFNKASSLAAISTISYWFQRKYKADLLAYLDTFLNDRELRRVYQILDTKKRF